MKRKLFTVTLTRTITETGQYVCLAECADDVKGMIQNFPEEAAQRARWSDAIDPVVEPGIKLESVEESPNPYE
jgi:hypothetical protein